MNRERILGLLLLVLAVSSLILSREALLEGRKALDPAPPADPTSLSEDVADGLVGHYGLIVSAATGIFRAFAVNGLWLRSVELQETGSYFEAAALARVITLLEPRMPEVWSFQARNLAYNIPAMLPPRERFPWIIEGLRLLRDQALVANPERPLLLFDLAFIYLHKLALDDDDAGAFYRWQFAKALDVPRDTAEYERALERWKIEPRRLEELERHWGIRLDLRMAAAHALYWASMADAAPDSRIEPHVRRGLRYLKVRSILELAARGRPLASVHGGRYAFLPDPDAIEAVRLAVDMETTRPGVTQAAADSLGEILLQVEAASVYHYSIAGRTEEARRAFEGVRARLGGDVSSMEDFLAANVSVLVPGDPPAAPDPVAVDFACALDSWLLLEVSRDSVRAVGFLALARLVAERRTAAPVLGLGGSFEACRHAAVRRRVRVWRESPDTRSVIPASIERVADEVSAGCESLPEPAALPFGLEVLDPAWRPRE